MNTRGKKKKRKSTTSTLEATTRQEDTSPPIVTIVQDTFANIPSTSGAGVNPVVTNRQDHISKHISRQLYNYMCHLIVGTEDHVKQLRLLHAVRDDLSNTEDEICITSGSFGEGLEMRGSDLDTMFVHRDIEVYDVKPRFNQHKSYFSMDTEDVKPGFTKLRLDYCSNQTLFESCEPFGNKHYLSSELSRQHMVGGMPLDYNYIIHGPCISDSDGYSDLVKCLHCKTWVPAAVQWITRSNNSWPCYDVKQSIMRHGVLFVPIGVKGSPNEDLEWRMSFSIGEKLLINTFTHTQLVCYALMKILLKDVIDTFSDCKDLLCSYFIKTIIFWISEELPHSAWRPDRLIPCFMQCFRRLIYCVEYSVCLHYFIPENNMFENKIEGRNRQLLLEKLHTLHSYGWRCILFSDQVSHFQGVVRYFNTEQHLSFAFQVVKRTNSGKLEMANSLFHVGFIANNASLSSSFTRVIQKSFSCDQSLIKYFYTYYMSMICSLRAQFIPLNSANRNNKYLYRQYTSCICTLLQNIYHDAVSGWLMLASFFYKTKQYDKALQIIMYSLSKCTFDKLYRCISDINHQWLKPKSVQNMCIVRLWKLLLVDNIIFYEYMFSHLLPDELLLDKVKIRVSFPCSAYAYFLKFLCHFHNNNSRQCQDDLEDLQLVIEEHYLMAGLRTIASAYYLLGIALQISGDSESAQRAFGNYHLYNFATK